MLINRYYQLTEAEDFKRHVQSKMNATDDVIPQLLDDGDNDFITGWRIQPKYHTVLLKYLTQGGTFGDIEEARQAIEDLETAAKAAALEVVREESYDHSDD
jgi:hypothetical protein